MNSKEKDKLELKYSYGQANITDNKIIILSSPSETSEIITDNTVSNPIDFDQIIIDKKNNNKYISFISISGIRRYILIESNNISKASINYLNPEKHRDNIFAKYQEYYINNYTPEKISSQNTKKSLSFFINNLKNNLQPEALSLCAQFVHWSLNATGFHFQGKYSAKLWYMEGLINQIGFHEIPNDSKLKVGDIMLIVNDKTKNIEDYYGHIVVWDGEYWLCDSRDSVLYENKKYMHLYRYDSWDE